MSQGHKYRAQILLEAEQHRQLAEIAKRENRSVSDVVREAVAEYVTAQTQESLRERRLQALETIRQHRHVILREHGGKPIEGDTVELIHRMREERGAIENLQKHRH